MQAVAPGLTTDVLVVFGIILLAFVLFVSERVPVDVTAILVLVLLVVFEPWTKISPADGIAGFANEATISVLALFVLSEGVRRSGVIQLLSRRVISFAGDDESKQLLSVIGISGLSAGVINNTPVVAMLIPMADEVARRTGTSPSKLLIPISYAAMFGGMLTLIGTSTNLLASAVSARLIGRRFTMFEFTHLGALVLLTGSVYLLVVGRHLIPDRTDRAEPVTTEYGMGAYLTEVVVREGSALVGGPVSEFESLVPYDVDVVQVLREGRRLQDGSARIRPDDAFLVCAPRETVFDLLDAEGLALAALNAATAGVGEGVQNLAEVVVVPVTTGAREALSTVGLQDEYDASVLAIRRGEELLRRPLAETPLRGGDTLLVLATDRGIERLNASREFVVLQQQESPVYRTDRIPYALGIVAVVVGVAAAGFYPIFVTALAGVVAMVLTGCLRPPELYDAVDWSVIFLLAGVIPLGVALERTGGAALLANGIVASADVFPPLVVLGLFYLITTVITEMISNNASVVLMIPVAVDTASQIGANEFAFVLAVTFAASTSILTPIGYQTNLMVYGAGNYEFTDFFRVGAPLQILLAVVTTLGIALFWGV